MNEVDKSSADFMDRGRELPTLPTSFVNERAQVKKLGGNRSGTCLKYEFGAIEALKYVSVFLTFVIQRQNNRFRCQRGNGYT